jgi:hypothetical protein
MQVKPGWLPSGCIAATLVLAGVAAVGASPASAAVPCSGGSHCYALVDSGTSPVAQGKPPIYISQVGADLEADCLAVNNPDQKETRHASWEMWVETNVSSGGFYSPTNQSWLEAGLANIALNGGPAGFGWLWAENPPSGQYQENWISQAAEDQRRNVTFQYLGGGEWNVAWNGTVVATPTDNAGNAGDVEIGAELAGDNKGQVNAHAWNWQYLPLNGGGWRSAVVSKTGYYPSNPANYNLTWGADPTTGLLDVTVHTTGNSQQCGDPVLKSQAVKAGTAHWTATPTAIRQVAAATIAAHASGHATSATVVRTTRRAATALSHETFVGPGAAASVYLVQETGSFTERVSSPYGTVTDHGNAVSMVIDARTGQVLDWTILRKASNLRALGTVSALPA